MHEKEEELSPIGKRLAIWGSLLQLSLVVGPMLTVGAMFRTFHAIQTDVVVGPSDLASGISGALLFTAIGLAISLIGFVLLILAVFACGYRASWLLSLFWMLAVVWFLTMPPVGLLLLIWVASTGRQFIGPASEFTEVTR